MIIVWKLSYFPLYLQLEVPDKILNPSVIKPFQKLEFDEKVYREMKQDFDNKIKVLLQKKKER